MGQSLKICLICHYPPKKGGISRYYQNLARSLEEVDKTCSLFIITNREDNASTLELESQRRMVLRIWRMNSPVYLFEIYKAVTSIKPNIVHVHYEYFLWGYSIFGYLSSLLFPILMLLLSRLKVPIVVHFDCVYPRKSNEKNLFKPFLILIGMVVSLAINRLSEYIMVWTPTIKQVLISDYGMNNEKVVIVPHGIELAKDQSIDMEDAKRRLGLRNKFVILFFGFIYPRKGIEYVIKSISEIVVKQPSVVLVIAGSTYGPTIRGRVYMALLMDLVKKLGLDNNVIFVNKYIPDDEVPLYFSAADTVVLPYVYAFGSASGILAKAASFKKATIATSIPMLRDYITNGVNSIVVPPANSAVLAKAILMLSSDEELRTKLGEALFGLAITYSWRNVAKKTLEVYQHAIQNYRGEVIN